MKRHGLTVDTSAESILATDDPAVTKAWREAHAAWESVSSLARFYISMFEAFDLPPIGTDYEHPTKGPNWSVLFAAGDQWSIEPGEYMFACLPLDVVGSDGAPARAILVDR